MQGGHSHSHGHGHSHSSGDSGHGHTSHDHIAAPPALSHSHSADSHSHSYGHGHSHSPPPSARIDGQSHSHSHSNEEPGHSHSHDKHGPSHTHEDQGHGHSHSQESNGHSPSHEVHGHSHSHEDHSHSYSHSSVHSHPQSISSPTDFTAGNGAFGSRAHVRRHSRGPSLSIHAPADDGLDMPPIPTSKLTHLAVAEVQTPITPNYRFDHDEHLSTHHNSGHSHSSGNHEGHSHNMRGVFLHVMAVSLSWLIQPIMSLKVSLTGYPWLCGSHHIHPAHPILWLDRIRSDCVLVYRYHDCCECCTLGHGYWQDPCT